MTTLERPCPAPTRPIGMANLKLHLIALLAMAYVAVWWMFGARAPRPAQLPEVSLEPVPSASPRLATWYEDLPPSRRPRVDLPPGWLIAETSVAPSSPIGREVVPEPVRVGPARPGRIRTRSS